MADRRMSRRQLLEAIATVGPAAALAPLLAACAGASTTPSPSAASPSAAPSVAGASASPSASLEPTPVPSPEADLNVYNWDAYIGEKTVKQFEDIGCDEFIFQPIKADLAHLDGLAEIVF